MTKYIKGVKNESVFMFFEAISKIPRASGNERGMAEYLVSFAKEKGLDFYSDEANNVLIVKEATVGRENEAPIMLQAHTDMVAEKNIETKHDFASEPIELIQKGNILSANGTTLGADDGFGVAIMLAILDSSNISHPRLECLFTSSEEIGLVGASKFDYSKIQSRRMINLDSAEENTVIIGCCGGIRTELSLPIKAEKCTVEGIKIIIGGLCGGHSGEDINKGRLNSNVLMGLAIKEIADVSPVRISRISGGDKDNAIPRECEAVIIPCDKNDLGKCLLLANQLDLFAKTQVRAEEDSGVFIKIENVQVDTAMSLEDTEKIIKVLSIGNGVLKYRQVEPILPETSRNLAKIRTEEDTVKIGFSSRSYLESGLEYCTAELDSLAKEIGGSTYHHEGYPGWASSKDSKLVTSWQKAYKTVSGNETEATLIHAGLECGLISANLDGLVAISVGCNVHDLHTPQETMEIDSLDRIFDTMVEFLKSKAV
ncbi:MAG: beta-Ala-His dipeptidase [Clostridia bacterium]|nr:beta-Ala-His dipeptidase [Clostridia bacterium]